MPEPGTAELALYQGDTFALRVVLEAADGPLDLTGQTAAAQIRKTPASADVLLELTCTIPDPATGTIIVGATAEETAGLAASDTAGVWDLELSDGTTTRTYVRGTVRVGAQVTRPIP